MISSLILTPWFLSAMTAPVEYENYQDPSRVDWARLSRRLDEDGDGRVTREEFPGRMSTFSPATTVFPTFRPWGARI